MSHRDRHASAGTTATVAAPPPKQSASAVTALRAASSDSATSPVTPWEQLYRSASPVQQADLLALASRQGLLYTHQLPPFPSSARSQPPADEPRTWNLLGKILAGEVKHLEPVRPAAAAVVDAALDEVQRRAVAVALATPDLCLIQGGPGTGKSRVLAEIVTQAAGRGDRVLLVAAHSAGIDRVLEQVAGRDALCALRCLAADESPSQLPPSSRALTLAEKAGSLRQQSLTAARAARVAAEMQCARRRHEEGLWSQFQDLAEALSAERSAAAHAQELATAVPDQVAREIEAGDGASPMARDVKALKHGGEQRLAQLAADRAAAEQDRDRHLGQVAALDPQLAACQPLANARRRGAWWSPSWWRALVKGDVIGRLTQLQAQRQQAHDGVSAADQRLLELTETLSTAAAQIQNDVQARIQAEIDKRQKKHLAAAEAYQAKIQRLETQWTDLAKQLDADTPSPGQTVAAVEAAYAQWQGQRHDDEARCGLAREWVEYLETSSEALAARLPGFANLVAATPAALAADPHFGDAAASGGQFDVLVLDEADHFSDSEFLKVARRARHWVLVGEPLPAAQRGRVTSASRGQYFHKLWEHLHCDPSLLPYAWFREGQRLGCRLRQLPAEQRQRLEKEPLADAPDVELRILALPRVRPVLTEVLFPTTMTLPAAKEFLFRELQEITVQTSGRSLHWCESPQRIGLEFGTTPVDAVAVALDNGVHEFLAGESARCRTCKLEFDRSAGWDRAAVEHWVEQHLQLRDLGRTAWLEVAQRMTPALAAVVADLLDDGRGALAGSDPAVEFVPVLGRGKGPGRDPRGPRRPEPGAWPTTGAGLEIDLAAPPRPGERLPSELRSHLPPRGYVNLPEARAVVRKLEELLVKPDYANGNGHAPPVAVVALYAAQVDLIRQLVHQCSALTAHAAAIRIGVPASFRHQEADIVLVSLTRSHGHRAVAYGDGPSALVQAWTRARRRLVLLGDPGNLVRRSQWRGVLDHLDEAAAGREGQILGQLVRYLHGQGLCQSGFRLCEGTLV